MIHFVEFGDLNTDLVWKIGEKMELVCAHSCGLIWLSY